MKTKVFRSTQAHHPDLRQAASRRAGRRFTQDALVKIIWGPESLTARRVHYMVKLDKMAAGRILSQNDKRRRIIFAVLSLA
jgi:hypothetical protein